MPLPPVVYATLAGAINQDTLPRIFGNLAGAARDSVATVHLLFQSQGGYVGDGIALYNFLRGVPFDLHVYNTGTISSIAVIAFLGAQHRYVSTYANFMIHKSRWNTQGSYTAAQLRAQVASLEMDDTRTEAILRAHTSIPAAKWALLATEDVLFDANEAVNFGLADVIREFQVPTGVQIYQV